MNNEKTNTQINNNNKDEYDIKKTEISLINLNEQNVDTCAKFMWNNTVAMKGNIKPLEIKKVIYRCPQRKQTSMNCVFSCLPYRNTRATYRTQGGAKNTTDALFKSTYRIYEAQLDFVAIKKKKKLFYFGSLSNDSGWGISNSFWKFKFNIIDAENNSYTNNNYCDSNSYYLCNVNGIQDTGIKENNVKDMNLCIARYFELASRVFISNCRMLVAIGLTNNNSKICNRENYEQLFNLFNSSNFIKKLRKTNTINIKCHSKISINILKIPYSLWCFFSMPDPIDKFETVSFISLFSSKLVYKDNWKYECFLESNNNIANDNTQTKFNNYSNNHNVDMCTAILEFESTRAAYETFICSTYSNVGYRILLCYPDFYGIKFWLHHITVRIPFTNGLYKNNRTSSVIWAPFLLPLHLVYNYNLKYTEVPYQQGLELDRNFFILIRIFDKLTVLVCPEYLNQLAIKYDVIDDDSILFNKVPKYILGNISPQFTSAIIKIAFLLLVNSAQKNIILTPVILSSYNDFVTGQSLINV